MRQGTGGDGGANRSQSHPHQPFRPPNCFSGFSGCHDLPLAESTASVVFSQFKCLVRSGIGAPCPESVTAGKANIKASALSADVSASVGAAHALWIQTVPRKTRICAWVRFSMPASGSAGGRNSNAANEAGGRGVTPPYVIFGLFRCPSIPPAWRSQSIKVPPPTHSPYHGRIYGSSGKNTVWPRRVIRPNHP